MSKSKPIPVRIVHDPIPSPERYKEPDRYNVSMRQIENGWIVNEHGYRDGKHFDRERFESSAPKFPGPSSKPERSRISAGPKARSDTARAIGGGTKTSSFMAVDMAPQPPKVRTRSPLNVPSDAALPRLKRLGKAKL